MPAEVGASRHGAGRSDHDRPAPTRGALERLTGGEAGRFADRHWGREPLLIRAADRDRFSDLLDLDDVDELLSRRGLRTPFLRLARDGEIVGSGEFTGPAGVGAEIGDQVRDDRVAALFADGATVVLQALHRTWPAVAELAGQLNADLGHPVQVNAYITPPSSRGFAAHYDVHDVFVLQLAGRKHWTVHRPVHADPLRDQPWSRHADAVAARARDDVPAVDAELEPGDVLYLPRGWLHAATARDEVSAHLTVGVHVVHRFALVEALVASVASDPELRASLPIGIDVSDPEALAPHLDDVRRALLRSLDRVSADAVSRRVRTAVWSGNRPEPLAPVAAAAFRSGLATGDRVRLRAGVRHRLVDRGAQTVLELADREISLPRCTAPAVRALLDGDVHPVGVLPGLDEADQLVLVRRLLREGVLIAAATDEA